ncbi:MAG: glutamate--tRNA ligase [Phycisphaerales bacterium]|nr:MAG: glutamate--tRNA ligase [Phycisphaerales bacterium]
MSQHEPTASSSPSSPAQGATPGHPPTAATGSHPTPEGDVRGDGPGRGVITRFAPSPTGHLHVGGARTALFCWAFARGHGGRFLLRIEDTDAKRSSASATAGILEDLAWLGIRWDEGPAYEGIGGDPRGVGPFEQAERIDLYNQVLAELLESGRAYPAFESPEELEAQRKAAQAAGRTYRYDRAALRIPPEERMSRMMAGEPHVVRFRAPDHDVVVRDSVLGEVRFAAGELDDFVIRKADGMPTYHFAVVVDDHAMGVTHVLRGQEHLQNTPRHVALQQALGYPTPVYAHLPLIFNPDGSKMSKRDKDKALRAHCRKLGLDSPPAGTIEPQAFEAWMADARSQLPADELVRLAGAVGFSPPEIDVEDFRRSGYLPQVLCNYLALLGWNPGQKNPDGTDLERFTPGYLAERFDLSRIGKSASRFDREKLLAFNADEIQNRMDDQAFADLWRSWLERYEPQVLEALSDRMVVAVRAARPRARTLREAVEVLRFAWERPAGLDERAVQKVLLKNDGKGLAVLADLLEVIVGIEPFQADTIESVIQDWCQAQGLGLGQAAQPLRVAVTGTTVSPGLGQTLELVGKTETLERMRACLRSVRPDQQPSQA